MSNKNAIFFMDQLCYARHFGIILFDNLFTLLHDIEIFAWQNGMDPVSYVKNLVWMSVICSYGRFITLSLCVQIFLYEFLYIV